MLNEKMKEDINNRMHALFEELVPMQGKCDCLAGEIIRAANRLGYRFNNDGDMVGEGYGNETCNPAARFLIDNCPSAISALVSALWEVTDEKGYEQVMYFAFSMILDYVEDNPDLRNKPTADMWDSAKPEDYDYWKYEEEEDYE